MFIAPEGRRAALKISWENLLHIHLHRRLLPRNLPTETSSRLVPISSPVVSSSPVHQQRLQLQSDAIWTLPCHADAGIEGLLGDEPLLNRDDAWSLTTSNSVGLLSGSLHVYSVAIKKTDESTRASLAPTNFTKPAAGTSLQHRRWAHRFQRRPLIK